MLRGTGSLQALLGRSSYPKKRTKQVQDESERAVESRSSARTLSPLKAQHWRCPVCNKQLHDRDDQNEHIDKCLSNGQLKRAKQQPTLLLFAQRSQPPDGSFGAGPASLVPNHAETSEDDGPAADDALAGGRLLEPAINAMHAIAAQESSESWANSQSPSAPADPPSPRLSTASAATQQLRNNSSACDAQRPLPSCFVVNVVGRSFQLPSHCLPGQRLAVEPEPSNPRDARALLVVDAEDRSVVLGHLPRAVAHHLGPLLRKGQAAAEAVVTETPVGDKGPVSIELQVMLTLQSPGGGGTERAAAAVASAQQAAEQHRQQPSGTGERLRLNFQALLETVTEHDGALLSDEEHAFIATYRALPPPAQCLFLLLSQRRGLLFRILALCYEDVPDAQQAAAQLQAGGLAHCLRHSDGSAVGGSERDDDGVSWEQLADLLTVPELAALGELLVAPAGQHGARASAPNRAAVLVPLTRQAQSASPTARAAARHMLLSATGPVLRLANAACTALRRLQRLFFLNEGHSLTLLLAVDAGGLRYPQYQISRAQGVFPSRAHLLAYEAALAEAEALAAALEEGDLEAAEAAVAPAWAALDAGHHKCSSPPALEGGAGGSDGDGRGCEAELPPLFLRRFNAGWVSAMMATAGVSLLERQRRYREAVDRLQQLLGGWCCPSRRGEWWVRLSTDLEHLGRPTDALEVAESALADEWLSQGDRLSLRRRVLRLGKPPRRWKRPEWAASALREPREVRIEGRPLNSAVGARSRFYGLDDEQCSVEELALQYYASEEGGGWRGVHSEGGVWSSLFALLLWPAIFSPVPDVFRTPLQTAPLDLDTDAFYPARRELIEEALERIAGGHAPAMLASTWEEHCGTLCRGVDWGCFELSDLVTIAECVGGPGLAAVCRLLAQDHGGWGGGMPDLLLWRAAQGRAKVAEVKGPRDRLSDQQRAWMAVLEDAGVCAEVLKVVEPGARKGGGGRWKGEQH